MDENPQEAFIFLGDYLDPYPQEGVTVEEAFAGLQEIVSLKESRPDRVTLLWGNHDLHYLYPDLEGSRFDRRNVLRNGEFFVEHQKDFQLAAEWIVGGERYLFTHAGVGTLWVESFHPSLPEDKITASFLNDCMQEPSFISALSNVSYYRGGLDMHGSCIWADLLEQGELYNQLQSSIQVFGHTMVLEAFNYDDRVYDLDCQECFYLDLEKGGIYALETGMRIIPTCKNEIK